MRELIITCKAKQKKLLEQVSLDKKISSFSFLSKQELLDRLYFRYDKRAIYYLVNRYHLLVENAILYLDNMYYVEDRQYRSKKLQQLKQMKKELESQNLLIHDALFPFYLKKYIVIYDEACMTKFDEKIVADLEKITEVRVIKEKQKPSYTHSVYEFETMEEEIIYVAKEIIRLYKSGISFQNIKLANAHMEYVHDIKRIFKWYHIPVQLDEQESIYSTILVRTFLELLGTRPNDEIIEKLHKMSRTEQDYMVINQITDMLNHYNWYDGDISVLKDFFIYDLKHTYLKKPSFTEMVSTTDLEDIRDDDYVFVLGMNTDTMPHVMKDEAYLSDNLTSEIACSTTLEKNKMQKEHMIQKINQTKHLVMTYKKRGEKGDYYPSSLLSLIQITGITKVKEALEDVSYSTMDSSMLLGRKLDLYYKYGVKSEMISPLLATLEPFSYQKYNHKYQPIDKQLLLDYLKTKDGLTLSYTNMDKYMKCGFYYYLDCILKLDDYQETFMTLIGNYFHHMLEIARCDDFDFDMETKKYFQDRSFTFKEKFLLSKLQEELKEVIQVVLYQESLSKYKTLYFEERIAVFYDYPIPVVMKGFIDKIMEYEENGQQYLALIDYKTGGFDIGLDECIHGFHLQLPIYAYLIRNSEKFKNSVLTGLYIAPILPNETLAKVEREKQEQRKIDMRLVGYSTDSISRLEAFDKTYLDSQMIKGMKVTSKGFGPYSKILSDETFDALVELTQEKIKDVIEHILTADFAIRPKYLKNENVSCRFCPYHDVCYKDYHDVVYLKEEDYHTFLGGD